MDTEQQIKELKARWQQLKDNRHEFEPRWTEAQQYCDNGILQWESISSLPEVPKRYSSLPYNYCKTLVAGIVGYAISPSVNWFKLSLEQVELLELYGVKDFLEECERVMIAEFNASNLYKESVPFVKDSAIIGHSLLLIDEDLDNNRPRYTKFPANELYIDINEYGEVDTVFRHYQDTLRNCANFFGVENLDENMQEDAENPEKWNNKVELLQCTLPREKFNSSLKDAKNKPYACFYIDLKNGKILQESGYDEFPYAVFTWDRFPGYAYSSSPAQDAMADIKALNIIKKTSLTIAQKSANPAFLATEDVRDIDLAPEGVTYLPTKDSRFEPLRAGDNYPVTLQELANYEQNIKDWFYVDYFLMLQQKQGNMTATEVMELQGEKAATLSSLIVALDAALRKIISRTFNILMKEGKLPEVPYTLQDKLATMKVDFNGPLAQAQKKYHTMGGTLQALQTVGPILQMFPNAGDFIDGDQLMKTALEGQGMPQNVIREDDDVDKLRVQRAQAEQEAAAQQQQMQMAQALMQNANKLGQAAQDGSILANMQEQQTGALGNGLNR